MADASKSPGDIFKERKPDVQKAHRAMVVTLREQSELDTKTRELIFIGIMTAARLPDALYSHTTTALKNGATPHQVTEACLQALAPIGAATFLYGLPEVNRAIEDFEAGQG